MLLTYDLLLTPCTLPIYPRHIVYNVKTEPMGFMVRRRYNDFNWLRETLASKYEGLFIPTLPTSSFLAISSDPNGVFVRNRMVQLQLFMQTLIQIPFVMFDSNLRDFLSVLDEKEFKILTERKETEVIPNSGFKIVYELQP